MSMALSHYWAIKGFFLVLGFFLTMIRFANDFC